MRHWNLRSVWSKWQNGVSSGVMEVVLAIVCGERICDINHDVNQHAFAITVILEVLTDTDHHQLWYFWGLTLLLFCVLFLCGVFFHLWFLCVSLCCVFFIWYVQKLSLASHQIKEGKWFTNNLRLVTKVGTKLRIGLTSMYSWPQQTVCWQSFGTLRMWPNVWAFVLER